MTHDVSVSILVQYPLPIIPIYSQILKTLHYHDVIMSLMVSQITCVATVCSTVCSGEDERKHQSSVSLVFVRGIHWWLVNSPHQGPVTRRMFHLMTLSCKGLNTASNGKFWHGSNCHCILRTLITWYFADMNKLCHTYNCWLLERLWTKSAKLNFSESLLLIN